MPQTTLRALTTALRDYGPRLARYFGVTVVNVITGLSALVMFHGVLGWPGVAANVAAVTISTIPAYLLSRRWVWGQTGPNSLSGEVAPFWAMAFLGLVLSTVMVGWASVRFEHTLVVYLANLASFGVLWVIKFFVLEKLMWGPSTPEIAPALPQVVGFRARRAAGKVAPESGQIAA